MRTREDILKDVNTDTKPIVELLLDLRDIMSDNVKISKIDDKSTELDIYYFIRNKGLNIDYKPYRDGKDEVLRKLRELNLI